MSTYYFPVSASLWLALICTFSFALLLYNVTSAVAHEPVLNVYYISRF